MTKGPITACSTPVAEGMVVRTRSPIVEKAQRGIFEFLLAEPSARLSDLRPRRRVSAAGSDICLRSRHEPLHRAETASRETDCSWSDHRPRPRALRPVLAMRAISAPKSPRTSRSSCSTAVTTQWSARSRKSRTSPIFRETSSSCVRWAR